MNKSADRKPDTPHARPELGSHLLLFSELQDERWRRYLMLALLALLLTLIIIPKGGFIPDYYSPGDIASRDVKAPRELLAPDQELTEMKRQEAAAAVPALYDYDPRIGPEIAQRIVRSLLSLHGAAQPAASADDAAAAGDASAASRLAADELQLLRQVAVDDDTLHRLQEAIGRPLSAMIVANVDIFASDRLRGVSVRNLSTLTESTLPADTQVIGLSQALREVAVALQGVRRLEPSQRQLLLNLVQRQLRPDLTFNQSETEARRTAAFDGVQPVLFQVKKGEMIVREGERVTSDQVKKLKALAEQRQDSPTLRIAFGLLLSVLLLFLALHRFARRNIRKYRPSTRDVTFLALTFATLFLLLKVTIFVSSALEGAFPYIDSASYYYLFPFAAGAMLVRIILNSEVSLVFTAAFALLVGVLFGNSLLIAFYVLVGSLVGAHWVRHCMERSILYHAGLRLSCTNLVMVFGLHLLSGRALDGQLLYKLFFAAGNGVLCALLVIGTIPLIEALFKYTTDIKLLELANMNNPLLRELMVQAPGTYHHSVVVGNLVEAAAEAINANPLLARVAAYYHDVGKTKKPLYFIENTRGLENRHDKLAPSMSALILRTHISDGVEMAREHRLGDNLVDIIEQHHGTSLMKFFFEKAKTKAGDQPVDELDYRYPGPKPQTREAALIMLADAVEAASRTLTDPTPARIQGMVQKIINNIFIDGQLDECELTLKDLHQIAKSFNLVLAGIFHNRIEYPEPAFRERDKESRRKSVEDPNREPAAETAHREDRPAQGGAPDLKRLGLS